MEGERGPILKGLTITVVMILQATWENLPRLFGGRQQRQRNHGCFPRFFLWKFFVGTSGVFCESLLGQWLNFKLFGIAIFSRENRVQALFSGSRTAK